MKKNENSYKKSGVNIPLANKLVEYISKVSKKNVKKMKSKSFNEEIGGFGSLFDISHYKIKDPVIVSCTDGVGTKIDLANKYKKFDTIGIDLVAMCINDLIVQGAKPLFFLDYIAIGKLDLKKIKKFRKIRLSSKKEEKSFTKNLHKIGYMKISQKISKKDRLIIKAFQRRFRQDLVNGLVDKECFLISKNLILS